MLSLMMLDQIGNIPDLEPLEDENRDQTPDSGVEEYEVVELPSIDVKVEEIL